MSTTQIFVKSIPRESALGIHEWTGTSGRKLEKTKIGHCDTKIMALESAKIGGLANYISYTPWINPETGLAYKEGDKELTLQDKFEQKYHLPKGFLTNRPYRKQAHLKESDLTYFQTKVWSLKDGTTVFDLNTMDGELGYYVLLASSLVANSEKEWRAHKWPNAEFYISSISESEDVKHSKNEIRSKAFALLHSTAFTNEIKRKIVAILDIASARTELSNQQVDNLLFDFVDKSTVVPGSNIDKLNQLNTLLSHAKGKEEFEARFILKRALDCRVVIEKQGTYTYMKANGPITIGDRYEEAVEFLLNPKKTKELDEILADIKAKE